MTNEEVCHKHSGVCAKVTSLEDNVSKLWEKWDGVQRLLIGTLISTALSLMGIIFLLLRIK